MQKIIITGATGFIGSRATEKLVTMGFDVSVIVRPNSDLNILEKCMQQIKIFTYDGSYDSVENAIKQASPFVVLHTAALYVNEHHPEDITNLIDSNIKFPTYILEAMSKNNVKQFINIGTSWQHYKNQENNPVNFYAGTKTAFESLLKFYIEAHAFKIITLKLFDTYGPNDNRKKLFHLLKKSARNKTTLNMSGGNQILDLVHVDDVIDAILLCIEKIAAVNKCEEYAVSNNQRLSLKDIVTIYKQVNNLDLDINWGALQYRNREVFEPWSKFNLLPDWQPKISIQNGLLGV